MNFRTNSYFDLNPEKIVDELRALGEQWLRAAKAPEPPDDLQHHLRSWVNELSDTIYDLEEGDDIDPLIDRLLVVQSKIEDVLGSVRRASRTANHTDRDSWRR